MESSVFLKVMLVIIIIIQIVATVFAIRLVRRTKYNSIWFLCIVGFIALSVERICLLVSPEWTATDPAVFVVLDLVISLCISAAVLFAHRLINYIDRLDRQRQLFNKRILTAVLRTEERSRSYFAKELHDGMGPLLSSAKMSLSALSKKGLSLEQQEILANTSYVIDEAIRSVREISNNMSPQVLNDFGLAQGIKGFISRSIALHGINIRFTTNLRKERFDNDVEVIMYRVICELINNSLKHSGCGKSVAVVRRSGTQTRLYRQRSRIQSESRTRLRNGSVQHSLPRKFAQRNVRHREPQGRRHESRRPRKYDGGGNFNRKGEYLWAQKEKDESFWSMTIRFFATV